MRIDSGTYYLLALSSDRYSAALYNRPVYRRGRFGFDLDLRQFDGYVPEEVERDGRTVISYSPTHTLLSRKTFRFPRINAFWRRTSVNQMLWDEAVRMMESAIPGFNTDMAHYPKGFTPTPLKPSRKRDGE